MRLRCFLFVAVAFLLTQSARADTYETLTLNGSFVTGGSIEGTLLLDTTQSSITSGEFTVNSGGDVTTFSGIPFPNQQPGYLQEVFSSAFSPDQSIGLLLYLPVIGLSGYQGSAVCSATLDCGAGIATYVVEATDGVATGAQTVLSGTVSATPEPSSLVLLSSGLLGAFGVMRRRLA